MPSRNGDDHHSTESKYRRERAKNAIFGEDSAGNVGRATHSIRRILALIWSDGHWYRFQKHFMAIMSDSEAILLSFLMNHARVCKAEEHAKGWFFCLTTHIEDEIFYKPKKQERIFKLLREKGFIKTRMRKKPDNPFETQRLIKIDYILIWTQLDEWMQENRPEETGLDEDDDL